MDKLVTFALVITLFLVAAVIAFTIVTNKIIKDQAREIDILRTDNERLRSAIRGAGYVSKMRLSKNPIEPAVTITVIKPEQKPLDDLFKEW